MKLVEILANELSEWPCDGPATQDPDKEIRFDRPGFDFFANSLADDAGADIGEGVEVTREMWQAERDRQKGGVWKRHRGGRNQPVMAGVRVEVKLRCGDIQQGNAHEFIWLHSECDVAANIMSYRVISQPQSEEVEKEVFVSKDVKLEYAFSEEGVSMEDLDWKPIGGKLTSVEGVDPALFGEVEDVQLRDTLSTYKEFTVTGQWHQIDGPIKWRDTVNELDAYIEEFTREREALINRLALEGFALLPVMTAVMGVADISLPIEEWQIGDIVEVVSVSDESSAPLGVFKITDIDASEPKYELDDQYFPNHEQMKFICRP